MMVFLVKGHLVENHRFSIFLQGNSIPEWFSQQSLGDDTYLQLPLNWCNKSILGFAICVVFSDMRCYLYSNIHFNLIEKSNMQFFTPAATSSRFSGSFSDKEEHVWLSFMSFDFFQLLFPDFKPDDWAEFEGYLCAGFSHDSHFVHCQKCAIRLVYQEDMKQMPTIQKSGALNDPTGRAWVQHGLDDDEHHNDDDDGEQVDQKYYGDARPIRTAYLKQAGCRSAKICFNI